VDEEAVVSRVMERLGQVICPTATFVRFERGRNDVMGPTFGPFEFLQQTYEELRISPDGETLAYWDEGANEWFLNQKAGIHQGEFYSDFVVYTASKAEKTEDTHPGSTGHDCAAGRVTHNDQGVKERWDTEKRKWVPTK